MTVDLRNNSGYLRETVDGCSRDMRTRLTLASLALLVLAACGDGSKSDTSGSSELQEMDAVAVAKELKRSIKKVTEVREITEDNDVNDLIGRPNGYTSAQYWSIRALSFRVTRRSRPRVVARRSRYGSPKRMQSAGPTTSKRSPRRPASSVASTTTWTALCCFASLARSSPRSPRSTRLRSRHLTEGRGPRATASIQSAKSPQLVRKRSARANTPNRISAGQTAFDNAVHPYRTSVDSSSCTTTSEPIGSLTAATAGTTS